MKSKQWEWVNFSQLQPSDLVWVEGQWRRFKNFTSHGDHAELQFSDGLIFEHTWLCRSTSGRRYRMERVVENQMRVLVEL